MKTFKIYVNCVARDEKKDAVCLKKTFERTENNWRYKGRIVKYNDVEDLGTLFTGYRHFRQSAEVKKELFRDTLCWLIEKYENHIKIPLQIKTGFSLPTIR